MPVLPLRRRVARALAVAAGAVRTDDGVRMVFDVTVARDGGAKPVCVARDVILYPR